jgi:integration host factor subunit alpha
LKFGQHAILSEKSISVVQNISQNGGREGFDRLMGGDVLFILDRRKSLIGNELLILRPARIAELFNTVACNLSSHLKQAKVFPVETSTSLKGYSMTLTKAQIVEALLAQNIFSKTQSAQVIGTLFELMKQSLQNGEDVLISGFGKFSVKEKRQRIGRNPDTGKPMTLPPRKVVTFKCSGVLRAAMKGEGD